MNQELVYAVKRYEEDGETKKKKQQIGQISNQCLELYMFPDLHLIVEPNQDKPQYERVLLVKEFEHDNEVETRYYSIGYTRRTQKQKYLNLTMFPNSEFVINAMVNEVEPLSIIS